MYIPLTKGFQTLVDDDLYEELSQYSWYASGNDHRPARRLKEPERRLIYIYHQILNVVPWELKCQGLVPDHINGDPLDNRRINLRIVSWEENARNAERHRNHKGIHFSQLERKYKVYVDPLGAKRIWLGTYTTLIEAEAALASARQQCE